MGEDVRMLAPELISNLYLIGGHSISLGDTLKVSVLAIGIELVTPMIEVIMITGVVGVYIIVHVDEYVDGTAHDRRFATPTVVVEVLNVDK